MPTKRPDIIGLEWDEQNEEHIEEHIAAWLIEDLIEGGDWFAFRNDRWHPPEHRLFVGRTPAGVFIIAVLRQPSVERSGIWRPITGWRSTEAERNRYRAERKRLGQRHD